jgi:hypothetical protein
LAVYPAWRERATPRGVSRCAALLLIAVTTSSAIAGTGPKSAPATAPVGYLERGRENEHEIQDECNGMKPAATMTREALARFFFENGRLAVEVGGFEAPTLTRINVSNSDGTWLVVAKSQHARRAAVRPRPMVLLDRYDFGQQDPDAIWASYANINSRSILISGESLQKRIIFNENPNTTSLTVNDNDPSSRNASSHLTFEANSLADLRNQHPAEYRKFLLPLLGKLMDPSAMLPGPSDVYEVFDEIPADDVSSAQLKSLLPHLDSTVPAEREAATAQIDAMGARGILAAMRMDLSTLTPEQQTALLDVIGHGHRAKLDDPKAAKRDPDFLLDCLEMDAPGVKTAAVRELTKVLGKPIAFDASLHGPAADAAVDSLRQEILGDASTKPSE